jgi:predicted patatin/cPLA2 family phospholipase
MQQKGGALKEVTAAMQKKATQRDDIRLLIIVLGGAMQGPYGAGQISALQEMGYTDRFLGEKDILLGISTGAPTCAFAMAGNEQVLLGTSYFYTICTTNSFINYLRMHQMVDVGFIEKMLRDGPMRLDVDAIKKNPAQFYIQAYNEKKQESEFVNAKNPDIDMISAIHASMAIPLVYNKKITIDESTYTDGAFADPLPIGRAMEYFKPTHVLILPNTPFNRMPTKESSKTKEFFLEMIPEKGTFGFIRKVLEHRQKLRRSLDDIAQYHNAKIGVAWPPEMGLSQFTQDSGKIKNAIKESAKEMFALFGEYERSLALYEEKYGNVAAEGAA